MKYLQLAILIASVIIILWNIHGEDDDDEDDSDQLFT